MINHFRLVIFSVGLGVMLMIISTLLSSGTVTRSASAQPLFQSGERTETKSSDQPVELGNIDWLRDLDTAVDDSKKKDKPIAILFQEVPG